MIRNVFRVRRDEIAGRTTMEVEGEVQNLGIVKNFKNDARLAAALPDDLAISWTHLDPQEELAPHWHDVPSMVIVCDGRGRSTGDTASPIQTGDVVCVPAWNLHGFAGAEREGFWALSVQFQETAIFEREDQPYTTYLPPADQLPSLEERALKILGRAGLPEVNQVEVDGVVHDLGRVKNFRASPLLDGLLPEQVSLAWVHLAPGQTLAEHVHETDSMILITEGQGRVFGNLEGALEEGDVVFVPAGRRHGFTGGGERGFWALSVQFEPESLYQDPDTTRVRFVDDAQPSLERLCARNEELAAAFAKNEVFELLAGAELQDERIRARFMRAMRAWSDHFQRLMHARYAFTRNERYEAVFLDHLLDELGHNDDLAEDEGPLWDATLDALGGWFTQQSLTLDNDEITVMVHLVLERGATVFYPRFAEAFGEPEDRAHFEKHLDGVDCEHQRMGVDLLHGLRALDYERLERVQERSWSVLNALIARVAQVTREVGVAPRRRQLHSLRRHAEPALMAVAG